MQVVEISSRVEFSENRPPKYARVLISYRKESGWFGLIDNEYVATLDATKQLGCVCQHPNESANFLVQDSQVKF